MSTYIEDHPNPHARQYRNPRRADVTGGIVVHSAENATDTVLPDDGAEGIAAFISRRTDAGSYHSVVDSSSIVRVVPYQWEAWGDGTGSNPYALHLSFACRAAQWPTLPDWWVDGALRNGAREAAAMARWCRATAGIVVPARRITPAQYRAGKPGFVGHGELDPGRRSDPGPAFPWTEFLSLFATEMSGGIVPIPSTPTPTWSLLDLNDTVAEADSLLALYLGEDRGEALTSWARDLATKLRKREDPRPTLDFIEWALANPAEAAKL